MTGRAAWLCIVIVACLPNPGFAQQPETLRVMLQGRSSAELATLVRDEGGTVTHELHIINAVGALVNRTQLDQILKSDLITRHIDDLSLSPPTIEQDSCNVGGALELQISAGQLRWPLYNKGRDIVSLTELQIDWPQRLGKLRSIQFAGSAIPVPEDTRTGTSSLTLQVPEDTDTRLTERSDLVLSFSAPGRTPSPIKQREINLTATFSGGCVTESIPGYERYGQDSYFPAVVGASTLHQHGITGRGVTVAVLDSGLWEHQHLSENTIGEARIQGRYDAILDRSGLQVFDESGHGTHMTSVLANSAKVTNNGLPTGSYMGIAPDVGIVTVKAFNKAGKGDFLDIVRGIQWVVDNREALNIRVLNLSFAARPRWPYWLDPINQALMHAWAKGVTVIAAAGNEGPDAMSIGSPGNLPYIITVGAVTDSWTPEDRNDDYVPDFSSQGPTPSAHIKPDVVAPGGHIAGITRPGSELTKEHPDYLLSTGEFVMTGTSQASALVSGIAALLLQLEPDLSPDDIKCKLTSSAEMAINRDGLLSYSPFQQGNGYVSATRAVTLGQRGCGNHDMDIALDIDNIQHYEGPAIISDDGAATLPGLDSMYSGDPTEKGLSVNRRWGVKAHIERSEASPQQAKSSIDWRRQYLEEKATIDELSSRDPDSALNTNSP